MHNTKEIHHLEQIKSAIAELDVKCQSELITQAMGIVSAAIDMVRADSEVTPKKLLDA